MNGAGGIYGQGDYPGNFMAEAVGNADVTAFGDLGCPDGRGFHAGRIVNVEMPGGKGVP